MDGAMDRNILGRNLMNSAKFLKTDQKFIFQQDNDPMHNIKASNEWLAKIKVDVLA